MAPGHMWIMNTLFRTITAPAIALTASLGIVCADAAAQSGDWFETVGGAVRLVVAPPSQGDAHVHGIMEIKLTDGWHTYWRDPGSSGIPPLLDVSSSAGLANARLLFPAPVWIDNPYGDFAGYDKPVALPFTLDRTANGQAQLVADVFLGICEEICIPVQTRFEMTIDYAKGTTLDAMRVRQAHAALPGEVAQGLAVTIAPDPPAGHVAMTVGHDLPGDATELQVFVFAEDGTLFKPPRIVSADEDETRFVFEAVRPGEKDRMLDALVTVSAGDTALEARYKLTLAGTTE